MSITIAFIVCALGFSISVYLFLSKRMKKPLMCPREHPCDRVVGSRFATTFGIPNEILGAIYFASIPLILLFPASGMTTVWLLYILFFLLIIGGLFSLYLIGLQAFTLRAWCLWCLGVALCNGILIAALWSIPVEAFAPILGLQKIFWVIVHNVGFILGLGAATITDILFFRFLKDHHISEEEKNTTDTLSSVIWVGLAILIISGVALYVPSAARLAVSSKFLLKAVVIGVIVVNGVLLNMRVAPRLRSLSLDNTLPARSFRRFAFALGGVSMTSWWLAFILGSLRSISIPFGTALVGYVGVLVVVVIGSQLAEKKMIEFLSRQG